MTGRGARAMLVAAMLLAPACASTVEPPSGGVRGMEPSEAYHFDSLPELVATADLVILGTIEVVQAGRTVPSEGDEFPTRYMDAVVRVEESLWGTPPSSTVTVETPELAPYETGWRRPGGRILVFLLNLSGTLVPASSQAIFAVDGEDLRAVSDDGFARGLAGKTLSQVQDGVAQAGKLVRQGDVAPVTPPVEPESGS